MELENLGWRQGVPSLNGEAILVAQNHEPKAWGLIERAYRDHSHSIYGWIIRTPEGQRKWLTSYCNCIEFGQVFSRCRSLPDAFPSQFEDNCKWSKTLSQTVNYKGLDFSKLYANRSELEIHYKEYHPPHKSVERLSLYKLTHQRADNIQLARHDNGLKKIVIAPGAIFEFVGLAQDSTLIVLVRFRADVSGIEFLLTERDYEFGEVANFGGGKAKTQTPLFIELRIPSDKWGDLNLVETQGLP